MSLRRIGRRKIISILAPACLVFFSLPACQSLTLVSREKAIEEALAPKEVEITKAADSNSSAVKPLVYTVGQDDVLAISVWQNLSMLDKGEGKLKRREYTINTSDLLEISVWQWPDLQKEAIVRPDGKISFPLVGDVEAEGVTLTELGNVLRKKLSEFIKSPQVSVMLKQYGLAAGATAQGSVSFIKVNDLSFDSIRVRPDGKISFPLVGDVQAEGLTLDELKGSLSLKIAEFVKNADVFIEVNEFGGNKVIILGEVLDPGVYRTASSTTALEALSLAGGYTKDAILGNVFVLRGNLSNPEVIKVNLSKAITGKDFSQNIAIYPRDIIYVPKSLISNVNYILTQLVQPLTSSASAVSGIKGARSRITGKK